jgi:hypothetical protein
MDGLLGGPAALYLHNHQTLPPKVQEMLESKMREIMAAQQAADRGEVVDAEVLTAPAEMAPAPTKPKPPEPMQQEEPAPLTLEERQNKHLRFHASLMKAKRGW